MHPPVMWVIVRASFQWPSTSSVEVLHSSLLTTLKNVCLVVGVYRQLLVSLVLHAVLQLDPRAWLSRTARSRLMILGRRHRRRRRRLS